MVNSVTIDSSVIISSLLPVEKRHEEACQIWGKVLSGETPAVMPYSVLVEVVASIRRRKREDNLNSDDKKPKCESVTKLVLAPGAADASEGMVCLNDGSVYFRNEAAGALVSGQKSAIDYKTYAEQQPGDGFWSVAPGCGDISEGRVWVVKVKQ